jgi:FlaA1/EpsC-like NDP-sugar epimerase
MDLEVQGTVEPVPPELVTLMTGRDRSIFVADFERHQGALKEACASARILVIGASGSIGSAVVKLLATVRPRALVLVDLNENTLADLVRVLRSGCGELSQDFATSVVAFGSPAFSRFLAVSGPFQIIFNFAALKHVRSERDPYSLMRMINTNALAVEDLTREASRWGSRLFSVSTDKAVFPTSLMGATKRWMERVLSEISTAVCTSARFANVAFSKGSLLNAILDRLDQRQPVAAPDNVRRYFMSHTEAAELCLLAGFFGRCGEIFVPMLDPVRDTLRLDEAARRIVRYKGLEPKPCASEMEARTSDLLSQPNPQCWPCYFSPADTTGEKDHEELLYSDEAVDNSRYHSIAVAKPKPLPAGCLAGARAAIDAIAMRNQWSKPEMVEAIRKAVPELRHLDLDRSLDGKL